MNLQTFKTKPRCSMEKARPHCCQYGSVALPFLQKLFFTRIEMLAALFGKMAVHGAGRDAKHFGRL